MRTLTKFLIAAALFLALFVPAKADAFQCLYWYGNQCVYWSADLLPNAQWCGSNPVPTRNQVVLYTSTNEVSSQYCQIVTIGYSNYGVSSLRDYGMYGYSWYVQSIVQGTNVRGWYYSDQNYSGQSHFEDWGLGTTDTYHGYGFYPASINLGRVCRTCN